MPSSYTVLSEKVGFVSQVDTASGRCLEDHLDSVMAPQWSVSIGALLPRYLPGMQFHPKAKVKERNPALSLLFCNKQEKPHIPLLLQVSCGVLSSHALLGKLLESIIFVQGFSLGY